MAGYFDYTAQKSPLDFTSGLNSLGDALTDVLNRRQKQKETDAKLALDQTQQDINNRKANEDSARFAREGQQDRANARLGALKYIGQGNPQAANIVMQGAGGEAVPGPLANIGPAPAAPGPAPAPPAGVPPEIAARRKAISNTAESPYKSNGQPMPPQYGVDPLAPPVVTDDGKPPGFSAMREFDRVTQGARYQDTKDMIAEEQAGMDAKKFGADEADYDQRAAAYPQKQADYRAAGAAAERDRPYTLRFGANDPGVKVDVATQRYAGRQQNADDFLASLDGLTLDDRGKQAAQAAHAAILAGADPKAAIRSFQGERIGLQGQAFKHGENQFHEQESDKRAAMIAQRQSLDPKSANYISEANERAAAGTRQDWKAVEDDLEKWGKGVAGLPLQGKSYPRLEMAMKNINSGVPSLQRDAQSALVSYFSGSGAVRKFEQEFLLSNLAGLGARGETALEHIKTGGLGPEDLASMQEATRRALKEQTNRAAELEDAAKGFGPGGAYDNFGGNIDRWLQTRLKAIGYDHEPLYPGQAPQVLGTTDRPYKHRGASQSPAAPKRAPGAPPEVKARDKAVKNKAVDDALGALGG